MQKVQLNLFLLILASINRVYCFLGFPCEIGDECISSENFLGNIKQDVSCEYFNELRRKQKQKYGFCGFIHERPLICCPLELDERVKLPEGTSEQPPEPQLGIKSSEECKKFGKRPDIGGDRIFIGRESEVGEFPHFVSLGYGLDVDDVEFNCAGVLISNKFVLTAAHCCKASLKPVVIRMGKTAASLSNKNDPNIHVDQRVKNVARHPRYKPYEKYHDIALVELETPVEFDGYIWPACLHPQSYKIGNSLTVAGFGRNDLRDETKRATWLMKADVEEYPMEECREIYNKVFNGSSLKGIPNGIIDELICANNRSIRVDACKGDSGAALKFLSEDVFYVVGIVSFGIGCRGTLPSFYTRVSTYINWIEQIVWP